MELRYPKTFEAARNHEFSQWAIGDALIEECGPPGNNTSNNGSIEKLTRAAKELEANGLEYGVDSLRRFRDVSHAFPDGSRLPCVSWSIHQAAVSPEMLRRVLDSLKADGVGVTRESVRAYRQRTLIRDQQTAQHAQTLTESDLRMHPAATTHNATVGGDGDDWDIEAARQTLEEPSDYIHRSNPDARRAPGKFVGLNIEIDAQKGIELARKCLKEIEQREGDLNQIDIDAIAESALEAHQLWLEVANRVRKNTPQKRGFLAAV